MVLWNSSSLGALTSVNRVTSMHYSWDHYLVMFLFTKYLFVHWVSQPVSECWDAGGGPLDFQTVLVAEDSMGALGACYMPLHVVSAIHSH